MAISEIGIEENEVWKHQDGNQEPKSEAAKIKKEDGRNTELHQLIGVSDFRLFPQLSLIITSMRLFRNRKEDQWCSR